MANDFCNVVEVIQAHARNLSDRVSADGGLRDVQQIQAATVRAAALVTRLLAFTRHEPLRPGTLIDLNLILDQLRPLLEALLTEKTHMVIDQGSKLGLLRGDASQIEQVIMNLALSACETLDAGGQLTIGTANASLNDDFARQNPGVRSGSYVRLSVAAKRLGPTSETSATPFLPSFHTDPQPERGMGLAMVSGIVKQMAGYIAIESQPGKASRFDLYWPEDLASRESSCFCAETAGKADEQAERTALTLMGSCSG